MSKAAKLTRRFLVAFALLMMGAWCAAYGAEWILRWRAEKLLAQIQSLQVDHTTWADVQPLLTSWAKTANFQTYRTPEDSMYEVVISHQIIQPLEGPPPEGKYYLPRLMNHVGLTSAGVVAGFRVKDGVVSERHFGEVVSLPLGVWFDRHGAYVPDLMVTSGEQDQFDQYEVRIKSSYPYRVARNAKGPYGVIVHFLPQEDATERAALMDFQLSCMTQLSPCLSEGQILPEGLKLLQEIRGAPSGQP